MQPSIWLILPLSILAFVLFWCFVVWIISRTSGWHRLAALYPATTKPAGRYFHMQAGYMGITRYGGGLTIGITPEGLYLAVIAPFRPGHHPLLIDWGAFGPVETTERRFFGALHSTTIATGEESDIRFVFPNEKIAEAIRAVQGGEPAPVG